MMKKGGTRAFTRLTHVVGDWKRPITWSEQLKSLSFCSKNHLFRRDKSYFDENKFSRKSSTYQISTVFGKTFLSHLMQSGFRDRDTYLKRIISIRMIER